MKRTLRIAVVAAVAIAASGAHMGGWAVITVENVPEFLEAGRPTTLEFTIRQHGQTPMSGLKPSVTMRRPGLSGLLIRQHLEAKRTREPGRYSVTLTAAQPGEVRLVIDANFQRTELTLLPITVVAAGQGTTPLMSSERGRQLFVAKGCVSCHMKGDDARLDGRGSFLGPVLTRRQFPADWLATKLADPSVGRPVFPSRTRIVPFQMPNLGLRQEEIAALVSYLNLGQTVSETNEEL